MTKGQNKNGIWIVLCALFLLTLTFVAWMIWSNTALLRTDYTVSSEKLPQDFNGYVIAQVSDLHNAEMGKNNQSLLTMLRDTHPDIIVITGDLIDANRTDTEIALAFLREAVQIAPCYMITGNHEGAIERTLYFEFDRAVRELGVTILHNRAVTLEQGSSAITLLGLDDPNYEGVLHTPTDLRELADGDGFCLMLSHRPELFDRYVAAEIDLVLSGHAHGGQIRLPLIGGLYAPGQGAFPEYDCGIYTYQNTNMVVSRGIGNSSFPLRFHNRPELVVVTLMTDDGSN